MFPTEILITIPLQTLISPVDWDIQIYTIIQIYTNYYPPVSHSSALYVSGY